jgi:metallo-beta-lactamase class B
LWRAILFSAMYKNIFLLLALVSRLSISHGQHTPLVIHPLGDNLFIYTTYETYNGTPFPSNSMYWVTDEGVVMVDTPWDKAQFQPLLDSIWHRHKKKVVMVLATHFHDDRARGFAYYQSQEIPTWSSKKTDALLKSQGETPASHLFEGDTTFVFDGKPMEVYYPGPGHTHDNVVVWWPEAGVLFGGCLVKSLDNQSMGNVADADLKEWGPSIRKLITRYPTAKWVVPGHFRWSGPEALPHTLDLLHAHKK